MPYKPNTLGKRIAELRERRGMLQKELAKQAGLSVSFLSEVENDRRVPGSETLLKIADVLGASLDYLLRGRSGPTEAEPLTVPPSLQEAAEQEGWSYTLTADLLKAQKSVVARRTPNGRGERSLREWRKDDWIRLYRSLFPEDG